MGHTILVRVRVVCCQLGVHLRGARKVLDLKAGVGGEANSELRDEAKISEIKRGTW